MRNKIHYHMDHIDLMHATRGWLIEYHYTIVLNENATYKMVRISTGKHWGWSNPLSALFFGYLKFRKHIRQEVEESVLKAA